jgi:hypothetical protein
VGRLSGSSGSPSSAEPSLTAAHRSFRVLGDSNGRVCGSSEGPVLREFSRTGYHHGKVPCGSFESLQVVIDAFWTQYSGTLISVNRHDIPNESLIAVRCRKSPTLRAISSGNDRVGGRSATDCSQDAACELHAHIPTWLLYETDLLHDSTDY